MPVMLKNEMEWSDLLLRVLEGGTFDSLSHLFRDEVVMMVMKNDPFSSFIVEVGFGDLTGGIDQLDLHFRSGLLEEVEFRDEGGHFDAGSVGVPADWKFVISGKKVKISR